jgi:predicted RNase H-like HicB family nuclease
MPRRLTAIIQREGDGYVALFPELDIASQGETIDLARDNLQEALELFLECASREEIAERFQREGFPLCGGGEEGRGITSWLR